MIIIIGLLLKEVCCDRTQTGRMGDSRVADKSGDDLGLLLWHSLLFAVCLVALTRRAANTPLEFQSLARLYDCTRRRCARPHLRGLFRDQHDACTSGEGAQRVLLLCRP
jgi:hypothetical protein